MDRLLQPATPPLDLRRQDTRRGLCYGRNDGEIGGVKTNPIHLSQAAKLSHQAGPPQVPFIETNVYGETPVIHDERDATETGSIALFLKPSKGVFGSFGDRSYEIQDKPHALYLAQFPKAADLLAGCPLPNGSGLVKIGISGNLKNRLKALNLSFPQTSNIGWKIMRTAKFPNRDGAAEAEAAFKSRAIDEFGATSLGKEYFVTQLKKAETLFNALSPATGLDLRISK